MNFVIVILIIITLMIICKYKFNRQCNKLKKVNKKSFIADKSPQENKQFLEDPPNDEPIITVSDNPAVINIDMFDNNPSNYTLNPNSAIHVGARFAGSDSINNPDDFGGCKQLCPTNSGCKLYIKNKYSTIDDFPLKRIQDYEIKESRKTKNRKCLTYNGQYR